MARNKKPLRAVNDFFTKSIIITWLFSVMGKIYKKVSSSLVAKILTSYDNIAEWFNSSDIVKFCKPKIKAEPKRTFVFKMSRMYEYGFLCPLFDKIKWNFLACHTGVSGLFGLTFVFISFSVLILDNFALQSRQITLPALIELINPIVTLLCVFGISVRLLFEKKTLIAVFNESSILSYIFFDVLRLRKIPPSEYEKQKGCSVASAVYTGAFLGIVSYHHSPAQILLAAFALLVILIVLNSPEAGVSIIIFALPFVPTMWIICLSCTAIISFFIKCLRRKRFIRVEGMDVLVAVFSLFVFTGGIFSVDISSSFTKMLAYLCFLSMYFIVKNTIRTEVLLKSCATALNTSALIVATVGIASYFEGDVSSVWHDTEMFAYIPGRTVSTFGNPNVLAEYLILVIPVIFVFLITTPDLKKKFAYFFVFMICSCCLIFTWSRGAWLGFAFAVILFILFKSHRFLAGTLLLLPAITLCASFIFGTSVMNRIASIGDTADSSTMYRLNIWLGTLRMFRENGILGIGIGEGAFAEVFSKYALEGTQTAPHTHSLYLQIISEMGILALVSFLTICLAFFSHTFAYICRAANDKDRTVVTGFMCSIAAFLVHGLTDYVWYNYKIYLLFWMMLGLAMSVFYISQDEQRRKFAYA